MTMSQTFPHDSLLQSREAEPMSDKIAKCPSQQELVRQLINKFETLSSR